MSVKSEINSLSSVETGFDVLDYLLTPEGLGYESLVEVPGGLLRDRGANDWYEAHLMDGNGYGIIRYIELGSTGETSTLSELKRYLKRHGSPLDELFTVIAFRKEEKGPLTSPLTDELVFLYIDEQFSSEDVEVTFDLRYFSIERSGVEPVYLDFLDALAVDGKSLAALQEDVEETFSIQEITGTFYQKFGEIFRDELQEAIQGLENAEENLNAYTRLVVKRVLFLLFVEEKGWLDDDRNYIENKYEQAKADDDMQVYHDFFEPLFFDALSDPDRHEYDFLGRIPFFNGGLFDRKPMEEEVTIEESFFDALLDPAESTDGYPRGFFRRYKFALSESNPSEQELVVDPEFIGRIFEMYMQSEERSEKGAFYTPKPITEYMAKNALKQYLLQDFGGYENEIIDLVSGHKGPTGIDEDVVDSIKDHLLEVRVVDPAVGSGAFIIAMIEELVGMTEALDRVLDNSQNRFKLKREFIRDSLYGVDIDDGGIELCKFRAWLYLIQDLNHSLDDFINQNSEYALPNLGLKFFVGNSLVGDHEPTELREAISNGDYQGSLGGNYNEDGLIDSIESLRQDYVNAHGEEKREIRGKIQRLTDELDNKISWKSSDHWMDEVVSAAGNDEAFKWSISVPEVTLEGGFDIVIGNPPYKGGSNPDYIDPLSDFYDQNHDQYVKKVRKMVYDRYQKFIYRGEELVRDGGIFTYIVNSTFRTIATKQATRNLLQSNRLHELLITNIDTFDAAVNAAVFSLEHTDASDRNYQMRYVNGLEAPVTIYRDLIRSPSLSEEDLGSSEEVIRQGKEEGLPSYLVPIRIYRNSIRSSFFEPDETNMELYQEYIKPASRLIDEWEDELFDVDAQRDNLDEIKDRHIDQLSTGDVTLLGLVTWGGEGLKTNNNKEHIAYIDGTYEADQVKERNGDDFQYIEQNEEAFNFINRVISVDDTIDPSDLSEDEQKNGVDPDDRDGKKWVPIEKGASTEDVYFKPTIQYIDWSQESLQKIEDRRGGRLRDPSYYFREGIFASRGGAGKYKSKARYVNNSVIDSSGVVLVTTTELLPAKYLLGILNSETVKYIVYHFINGTLNVQVSDMRLIPIPIPSDEEREELTELVEEAIAVKKDESDELLEDVQDLIDDTVEDLYGIEVEYVARWY